MILPASAIMYASGSLENSDDASSDISTASTDTNDDSSSSDDSGSTNDNADVTTTFTENNPPLSSESTLSNNTGNVQGDDLSNSILTVHNQERAAVGVQPLTWSDTLASSAQTWAQHLATTGNFAHDPNVPNGVGENIAGFNPSLGVSAPGEGQSLWVDEKKNYNGGVLTPENWYPTGHYTQMIWKDTTEIGAGKAVIRKGEKQGWTVIVCNYNPPGNIPGRKAYLPGN